MSPFVPALLIKLTIVLAVGLTIVAVLHAASPSLKHMVLFATLTSALLLPPAMLLAPHWNVPVLPEALGQTRVPATAVAEAADHASLPNRGLLPNAARFQTNTSAVPEANEKSLAAATAASWAERWTSGIPLAWALGFFAVLAWLTIGRLRLSRIGRSAWPLDSADWRKLLAEEQREAGVEFPVRLCSSPVVSTPVTWGWQKPIILLPEDAGDWRDEHRRIVLRHELAHIARRDSLAQLVAGISCALYWFHPAVWAAERRLRAECERACDDRVVSQGTPAADYAAHLLEVARSARAFGAPGFLSVAMARPSQLEGRLLAVLSESRRRASASRGARRAVAVLAALVLLPLAAFRAVPTQNGLAAGAKQSATSFGFTTSSGDGSSAVQSATIGDMSLAEAAATAGSSEKSILTQAVGYDSTLGLSTAVRPGGTLTLELKTGGTVTITGWDRPEVSVEARLRGRDWKETEVHLRGSNDGATLESDFTRSAVSRSSSHAFIITVPRNFNVRVSSAGGAISISNVNGNFSGETGGGEINLRNATGRVDLDTGGGDIEVSDSHLDGDVRTGGGMVKIERVSGNLNGSSGSGPVTYIRSTSSSVSESQSSGSNTLSFGRGSSKRTISASAITMTSAGGDVRLPEAPNGAYVTTGGGHVRIGPSGGEVFAETGGGAIDVGPASGSVEAVTGAGDVRIELNGSDNHKVDVSSGTGEVTLTLPADLNATLDLETAYTNNFGRKTRIAGDFPVKTTETTTWDDGHGTPRRYVRVHQTIGRGGPVIRIRTVNGDINLLRR